MRYCIKSFRTMLFFSLSLIVLVTIPMQNFEINGGRLFTPNSFNNLLKDKGRTDKNDDNVQLNLPGAHKCRRASNHIEDS
jgi:hypothetical protein